MGDFIEWRTEALNLASVRVPAAEQDVRRQLQALRDAFGATVYQDLLGKELTNIDLERAKWEDSVQSSLASLKRKLTELAEGSASVSIFKENLQDFKRNNKENFASLRSQELALTAFFDTTDWDQRFDDMLTAKSERFLTQTSEAVSKSWANQKKVHSDETPEDQELIDLRAAITAITAELDAESPTGDLTAEEHALFLRYNGNPKKLETALPQLTGQQISDHTAWWFGARVPKEQLKKRLLVQWRERREALRLKTLDPLVNVEKKVNPSSSPSPSPGSGAVQLHDRIKGERRRQAVEEWRRQKAEETAREQEERQRTEEERKRQERDERLRRQEERNVVMARLKAEKEQIERDAEMARLEIEERDKLERLRLIRASSARINERNKAIEEKRKTLIQEKTEKQHKRQMLQMTLAAKEAEKIKAESKLFAQTHTTAFREQTADEELEREKFLDRFGKRRADSFGGQVLRLQGRALPGWRRQ